MSEGATWRGVAVSQMIRVRMRLVGRFRLFRSRCPVGGGRRLVEVVGVGHNMTVKLAVELRGRRARYGRCEPMPITCEGTVILLLDLAKLLELRTELMVVAHGHASAVKTVQNGSIELDQSPVHPKGT